MRPDEAVLRENAKRFGFSVVESTSGGEKSVQIIGRNGVNLTARYPADDLLADPWDALLQAMRALTWDDPVSTQINPSGGAS